MKTATQAFNEWAALDSSPQLQEEYEFELAFMAGWHAAMVEINGYIGFERGRYCAHHGEIQPCSQHRWIPERD